MNWKKILAAATFAFTLPASAFAHGELWYDATSHLPQYKKIVVYPLKGRDGNFKIDVNEKSEVYQANDYFDKRFVRKLKIKTIPLGSSLQENKEIRIDEEKYKSLLDNFSSEEERAKTVTSVTASNGYVIPAVNLDYTEPHISPAKTVTVDMTSYTKEIDGPKGDRTYDQRTWKETHTIPQYNLMLYHFGLEYNMFDREGKKIMTYRNAEHTYGEMYGALDEKKHCDRTDDCVRNTVNILDNLCSVGTRHFENFLLAACKKENRKDYAKHDCNLFFHPFTTFLLYCSVLLCGAVFALGI